MFKFFRSPRSPRLSRSPRSRWLRPLISLISLIRSRIARSLHLQISLVILTIFVPLALIVLWYGKHPALAGWWPDGGTAWLNRKQLTLTNNSGGNLNANAASSTDYYLYYNNPDASTPTNDRTAFNIGSANATFICSYDNTTTCLAAGTATPTLTSGTARYSGSKSALSFDSTSDYVTTGNIGSGIKTVEFWVYPTSTTNYFVDLNGSAYISASGGTVSATGFTSPTIYVNGAVSSTITANTWQHIASLPRQQSAPAVPILAKFLPII